MTRFSSVARSLLRGSFGRLAVPAREWAALIPVLLLAAADRFVNLPARGIWDTDQGFEMGAIWNAVVARQLPTFGSPAFSTGGTFHHGALFYDLMIPVSWISNGNPTAVVAAIALFGFVVVPLVWWTARSIGGTAAGLATALLAAVSPSLIDYSTFIWNPVIAETGVALACLGAWQAWSTRGPRWWVVAAAGTAMASQAHLTGLVLVFPMAILFLLALRRSPSAERRRLMAWGLAGAALFLLTWMPWIVSELTHNFAETRAILAFNQDDPPAADPLSRFFFGSIRILAWPMTHWPLDDFAPGFPAALAVAVGTALGLIWRVTGTLAAAGTAREPSTDAGTVPEPRPAARKEREGLRFVGGSLLLIVVVLTLGIKEISQFTNLNQEQYHCVADVFVLLATGLVVGGLWRSVPLRGRPWSGHVLASFALLVLVVVGIAHWPPLTAPDGGWPAAQVAASRLERDTTSRDVALVTLPTFMPPDAYGYPMKLDGYRLTSPAGASEVVLLCYPGWADAECGGAAEANWLAANMPGHNLTLIDRFEPAPKRVLSVYRQTP
jgi:4-amino-4-deoxy-L-arabinose transferase-like glycosyltransferase